MTNSPAPTGTHIPAPLEPPFCVGCGRAHASGGFIRCRVCWFGHIAARFCKWCGEEIDPARRNSARKHRRPDGSPVEATQCRMCAKCGPRIPQNA